MPSKYDIIVLEMVPTNHSEMLCFDNYLKKLAYMLTRLDVLDTNLKCVKFITGQIVLATLLN